jgi:hypothetical protein
MLIHHKLDRATVQPIRCQQEGQHNRQHSKTAGKQQPLQAYSKAPARTRKLHSLTDANDPQDWHIQPLQQQQLDDPVLWPQPLLQPDTAPATMQPTGPSAMDESSMKFQNPHAPSTNPLRLPAHRRLPDAPLGGQPGKRQHVANSSMHLAARGAHTQAHRHPPVAPEDHSELLKVRQL